MSTHSDVILIATNLAVNLLLLGCLMASGVAVSFRVIKNSAPRLRYVIAVAAFLIAVLIPLAATLSGSFPHFSLSNSDTDNFGLDDVRTQEITPLDLVSTHEIALARSLNDFTFFVAHSWPGAIIIGLWVLGSAYLLFRDLIAHWRLRRARQFWQVATTSERKELLCPEGIPLYFNEEQGPGAAGLFSPAVVLPRHFPDNLSLSSRRYILRHEVAHARWRDPLVNSLLRLLRSLFWISPAVWLLERAAGTEREAAADYAAIGACSADQSEFEAITLNYSTALLTLAKQLNTFKQPRYFKTHITALGNGSRLERRVHRLLAGYSQPSRLRLALAITVLPLSLAMMGFLPVAARPNSQAQGQLSENEGGHKARPLSSNAVVTNLEAEHETVSMNGSQVVDKSIVAGSKKKTALSSLTKPAPRSPTMARLTKLAPLRTKLVPLSPITAPLSVQATGQATAEGMVERLAPN